MKIIKAKKITKKNFIKVLRAGKFQEREIQQLVNLVKSLNGDVSYYRVFLFFIVEYELTKDFNQTLHWLNGWFKGSEIENE